MSQITDALKSRNGRGARAAPAAVLACWSAGALVFAVLPTGSDGRYLVANTLSLGAAVFAVFALARAIGGAHGRQRLFWGLLGAGLVANLAGDLGWSEIQQPPSARRARPCHTRPTSSLTCSSAAPCSSCWG